MKRNARKAFVPSAINGGLCTAIFVGSVVAATQSKAQTCGPDGCIEETFTLNQLDYRQPDAALPGDNFTTPQLYVNPAGNFVPNPPGPSITFANEQAFAAQTTVTATQNGQAFNLQYLNSPALPDYFSTLVKYNAALAGSWTLQVANPGYGTLSVTTQAIPPGTPKIPFITNIQASDLSPTATLSWFQPGFTLPPGTTRKTTLYVINLSNDQVIDLFNLPGTPTSYKLGNLPTIPLSAGDNYAISVDTLLVNSINGQNLTTSRSYFNFSPETAGGGGGGLPPAPLELPSETPLGVNSVTYDFNFNVAAKDAYDIDPAIARGFVYETGAGEPNFASVELPNIGNPNDYKLFVWNGSSFVFATNLGADTVFNFGAGGVREFEVLGISPNLGLNVFDSNDFVTQVAFTGPGTFTGTMTPVVVPKSSTWAMMLLGFVGLGFTGYLKARSRFSLSAA